MSTFKHKLPALPIAVAALVSGVAAPAALAEEEVPWTVGRLYFQLNDTDGDLGIHMKIDDDAWKRVEIEDPSERTILNISVRGRLRRQGLTELSFESAEPGFDELSPEEFFARFPEGIYEIEGERLDGVELESEILLTHVMPAPPENLRVNGMATPDDCEEEEGPTVSNPVTISWDAVTESHPDLGAEGPVEAVRYELAVEIDEGPSMTVNLTGEETEVDIPANYLALGEEFKFQVLVQDAGGNETSSESCFLVAQ